MTFDLYDQLVKGTFLCRYRITVGECIIMILKVKLEIGCVRGVILVKSVSLIH